MGQALIEEFPVLSEAHSVSIAIDRVALPRKNRSRRRRSWSLRSRSRPMFRRFSTRRTYGRMPKGDVRGLCRGLVCDLTAMQAQSPELKVAYLTDAASVFEALYDQHLKTPLGPDAVSFVDFWHAAECLGAAGRVSEVKRKAKPGNSRRWRHALKHGAGAAAVV